jgi:hypothetical protein
VDRAEQDTLPSAIAYAIGIKGVLGAGTRFVSWRGGVVCAPFK